MNSKIYSGQLMHARLQPVEHRFNYPVYFYSFDLDELEALQKQLPLFGYNRWNLISLHDKDYLDRGPGTIREKLLRFLRAKGLDQGIARIELVTGARYFGYVFNPASFFYCYDADGELAVAVTQVNNTFGEMHLYISPKPARQATASLRRGTALKEFHVSPFFDRQGEYEFLFSPLGAQADICVNLYKEGRPALLAQLTGKASVLDTGNLIKTVLRFPFSAALAVPRIHWQALKLHFQKKLPVYKKPVPSSPMTIRTALPGFSHKIAMALVLPFLDRLQKGRLTLVYPDGRRQVFGNKRPGFEALIQIHHYRFFSRLARAAGIGLGEGYMEEDWDTPDLTAVLQLFVDNKPFLEKRGVFFETLSRLLNRWRHLTHKNSVGKSRKNIREHYDLGNDFFEIFLDETMTYSCAFFRGEDEDLEEAQRHKIRMMIKKAKIGPDDHVLEIGSGWGAFAIEAVRQTGCRVTGLTLSEEQLKLATFRVGEAGLSDRIEFKLCDYRNMTGTFDRIVSIEMLEAVGHEFLGTYFQSVDRLLAPDGIAVIQVITIPDQRYESYRRGCDFIQKHIFPGGHLPSLTALSEKMTQFSSLMVENLENIGPHYAETLKRWRLRFNARRRDIEKLGYPARMIRAWNYYFSYCEAGFASRHLNNLQLVLTRPGNQNLNLEASLERAAKSNSD